jgi:6-phosphogluconolactonase
VSQAISVRLRLPEIEKRLMPEVVILPDADALAAAAAERITAAAAAAIRARGRFTLVLSGGSTPERTYSLLAAPPWSNRIDWPRTCLFFGDERFVSPDDPRSNYAMARRSLLSPLSLAADHVFPILTDKKTPAESAAAYAEVLGRFFNLPASADPPRFDLILLGLGDDGHTASLFPHARALEEKQAWATWSPPGVLPPPVERVTLTFPVLNAARQVMFLVAGVNKAQPVHKVIGGLASVAEAPAAGVKPERGAVTWLVDAAAASQLNTS